MLVVVTLGWFIGLVAKRVPLSIPYTPLNTPIIVFSILMVISAIWGVFKETTTPAAAFFFTLKRIQYFLIFLMVIANVRTYKQLKFNVTVILAFATIVAVWGALDYYLTPISRASGPFRTDQNALLGGFLLIIIFIALAFIIRYPRLSLYIALLPLIIISFCAIAFTTSRASYVGLLGGLIAFALLSRRLYLIPLLIVIVFAMIYLLPSRVSTAVYSIQGVVSRQIVINPSWEARVGAWVNAIPKIASNPVLGHGPGSFPLSWADNQYVTDLLYMGFIGLGLFLWIIRRIYLSLKPLRYAGPPTYVQLNNESETRELPKMQYYIGTLNIGYIAALVALLIQGFAVATFYTVRIMVPFWFLTGLMMVSLNLANQDLGDVKDSGITGT